MFDIKDAVGRIANAAVFATEDGGYILIDWPFGWKRIEIR